VILYLNYTTTTTNVKCGAVLRQSRVTSDSPAKGPARSACAWAAQAQALQAGWPGH